MTSYDDTTPGRERSDRSRPRAVLTLGAAGAVAALVVAGAVSAGAGPSGSDPREGSALVTDWTARTDGQQVLGGEREPGVPTIQRIRHDDVQFTVTVAPARPGPNLVRIDALHVERRSEGRPGAAGHATKPAWVGTSEDSLVKAVPRPGTDGLWATVDLPEGSGTVLVTHGRWHRVPFAVETGTDTPDTSLWTGDDGPECVAAATAEVITGALPSVCPAAGLKQPDETALLAVVDTLAARGVEELAVEHDPSARSRQALAAVTARAEDLGVEVVDPAAAPGERNALLVVSGWADAARSLAEVTATPLRRQPIRSDGTWLAPWLLSPGVVDSTAGAMVPLDFDIRTPEARDFSATLATYLPGQSPTSSGFAAWRSQHAQDPLPLALYAASRAAYMPSQRGHEGHETQVAWFPGGTVTPVGLPLEPPVAR
ncbi:hypothetical protein [Nocardioides kribbensis]|uniref:hypothetical protein n=1 Tax=Nocardioides kribbensis TaxID=305517 RepID=UPI0032DBAA0D